MDLPTLRVLTHGPQFRGGSVPQMQNEGRSIVSLPLGVSVLVP